MYSENTSGGYTEFIKNLPDHEATNLYDDTDGKKSLDFEIRFSDEQNRKYKLQVKDMAGNIAEEEFTIRIDGTPPGLYDLIDILNEDKTFDYEVNGVPKKGYTIDTNGLEEVTLKIEGKDKDKVDPITGRSTTSGTKEMKIKKLEPEESDYTDIPPGGTDYIFNQKILKTDTSIYYLRIWDIAGNSSSIVFTLREPITFPGIMTIIPIENYN